MKHCPTCNRTYSDDLGFCLDDGSPLLSSYDPDATLVASRIGQPTQQTQASPIYHPPQPSPRRRNHLLVYVVVALLALVVGGGIVALLRPGTKDSPSNDVPARNEPAVKSKPQSTVPAPPPKPTTGSFQVYATSFEGTPFTSPYSKSTLVDFRASGQWTFNPRIGFHSAAGYENNAAGSGYALQSKPPGSLIVRRGNGTYEYVGDGMVLRVDPNERIVFLMNDDIGQAQGIGFADNRGSLSVTWACQDCNP